MIVIHSHHTFPTPAGNKANVCGSCRGGSCGKCTGVYRLGHGIKGKCACHKCKGKEKSNAVQR